MQVQGCVMDMNKIIKSEHGSGKMTNRTCCCCVTETLAEVPSELATSSTLTWCRQQQICNRIFDPCLLLLSTSVAPRLAKWGIKSWEYQIVLKLWNAYHKLLYQVLTNRQFKVDYLHAESAGCKTWKQSDGTQSAYLKAEQYVKMFVVYLFMWHHHCVLPSYTFDIIHWDTNTELLRMQ